MSESWTGSRIGWGHRPTARGGRKTARAGMAEREAALARAPLFAGLSRKHLRQIARISGQAEYSEGATVVKEGAAGSVFFVILDGAANVFRGRRRLATLSAGDFFGEMSLLDGGPRRASVITTAPSRFLTLSGKDLVAVLESEPRLASRILSTMAGRLRAHERPLVG